MFTVTNNIVTGIQRGERDECSAAAAKRRRSIFEFGIVQELTGRIVRRQGPPSPAPEQILSHGTAVVQDAQHLQPKQFGKQRFTTGMYNKNLF